jgi:hypothetical protein
VPGVAGAISGTPEAGIAGAVISAANPTWENTKARRTGAVGMSLQVVEPDRVRRVLALLFLTGVSLQNQPVVASLYLAAAAEKAHLLQAR